MSEGDRDATTLGGRKASVRWRLCLFSALVAVWPSVAHAKIIIRQAQYTGGMLLVRGETAWPGQTVTLAGRYKTRTDRNGRFRFRVRYLPRDCLLEVRSGPDLDLVSIANCKPR
jgi:hypothetical protein